MTSLYLLPGDAIVSNGEDEKKSIDGETINRGTKTRNETRNARRIPRDVIESSSVIGKGISGAESDDIRPSEIREERKINGEDKSRRGNRNRENLDFPVKIMQQELEAIGDNVVRHRPEGSVGDGVDSGGRKEKDALRGAKIENRILNDPNPTYGVCDRGGDGGEDDSHGRGGGGECKERESRSKVDPRISTECGSGAVKKNTAGATSQRGRHLHFRRADWRVTRCLLVIATVVVVAVVVARNSAGIQNLFGYN